MKLSIYFMIFVFTAVLAVTAFQAASNHLECQTELSTAATKIPTTPASSKDPIKEAFNSPSCSKMTTFGKIVEDVFK